MEGVSIIIPVFNKLETTIKCIECIAERNSGGLLEIIIVDNGSTDGTEQVCRDGFKTSLYNEQTTYIRNPENLGVAKALNIGARAAKYDVLCFMHNDVFVFQENWAMKVGKFIRETPDAGVVGLYGAKTLRKDGTFRGKTIVHAKKARPAINKPLEKVAVVDGLLMAMERAVFDKISGFCEDFNIHFYDKDISMRALQNHFMNYVVNIPFEHLCASTRKQVKDEDKMRSKAQEKFIGIWKDMLPVDVSSLSEKLSCLFKRIS